MPTNEIFEIKQDDLRTTRFIEEPTPEPGEGEAVLRLEAFAVTANSLTYAVFGELMNYWGFFPGSEAGWGRCPVWGFARVAASRHPDLPEGRRVYGYFPMARSLKVEPVHVSPAGFSDGAAHRQPMAAIYNTYLDTQTDPFYRAETEGLQMLFRPLFMTAFLIDDFLMEADCFGAKTVLYTSASAKTSYSAAYQTTQRPGARPQVIGLTSARNKAFTESLGCYDQVLTYDEIEDLAREGGAVLVDVAGDNDLRRRIHTHFGDSLTYACMVGAAHWDKGIGGGVVDQAPLPGPEPVLFFAPDQGEKRVKEWGAAAFQERSIAAFHGFVERIGGKTTLVQGAGPQAVEKAYRLFLDGGANPAEGHILSL